MQMPDDWRDDEEGALHRKRIGIRAVTIAVIFFVLIIGSGLYYFYNLADHLLSGMCGNQIMDREAAPDNGKYDLVVFRRDCGATTGYSYQLSIIKQGAELSNSKGNVFISNDEFTATWYGRKTVLVRGSTSKVFKQEKTYKGITIHYNTA